MQLKQKIELLDDAIKDADVFLGLSAKDALNKDMVKNV